MNILNSHKVAISHSKHAGNKETPLAERVMLSFDGGVRMRGIVQQPDRYRYWSRGENQVPRISRGAGLSYAAASFLEGGVSVLHASFDRITGFDRARKIVEVEAGISLYALHCFLSARGLYLPVQPGHGRITVGGCVAADVHGKNQARDGNFVNQVESLVLFHPNNGCIELSRQIEPELFNLTCGGYGLTGHIVTVRLKAKSLPSRSLVLKADAFNDVIEGFGMLRRAADNEDLAYTWHDMASSGKYFGRGYVFKAHFIPAESDDAKQDISTEAPPLSAEYRAAWPIMLLNLSSVRAINRIYRLQQRSALEGKVITLQDALFPVHKAHLYFRFFGLRGFHEYQVIIPIPRSNEYIDSIVGFMRQNPLVITLASAKLFAGSHELLRFKGNGICLALNITRTQMASEFLLDTFMSV